MTARGDQEPISAAEQPMHRPEEEQAGGQVRLGPVEWGILLGGGALIVALYREAFAWLAYWWNRDPFYSFGPLVPFVSAYLFWERRREYLAQPIRAGKGGGWMVVTALLLNLLGGWWDVKSLSAYSFVVLLIGLLVLLQGWERLKVVAFPCFFLFLAVPLPGLPLQTLSLPLQLASAKAAAAAGNALLGMGIQADGITLKVGEYQFAVEEGCSGLRNIISLFTLSILMAGLWSGQPLWKRLTLVAVAPFIAVVANAARIVVIVCIGKAFGPKAADSFFHEVSGVVVFGVALVGILVWMEGVNRIERGLQVRSAAG